MTALTITRTPEIENILRQHPGVRASAACEVGGKFVAFVVPDDSYLADAVGQGAESAKLQKWKKTYDLSQMGKEAASAAVGFNIAGWHSTYTRQPIPAEQMREWVECSVQQVLSLKAKRVLEIGCGTGLLLLRLAPGCERYVGVDFSPVVLGKLRDQLAATDTRQCQVELLERTADNFTGLDENSFDAVVINSAAQYFPTLAYLERVLRGAERVVRPGGYILLGDLRSLLLAEPFALSVEAYQAAPELTVAELRERAARRLRQDVQLLFSPAYFLSLVGKLSKIRAAEIEPRHGSFDNEMTRYRYDAILHVGGSETAQDIVWQPWSELEWPLDAIRRKLERDRPTSLGLAGVTNARIELDIGLMQAVASAPDSQDFASLLDEIKAKPARGISPQAMFDLGREGNCSVALSWASCRRDGSYDVVFSRDAQAGRPPQVNWPEAARGELSHYSNAPGQALAREKLVAELIEHGQRGVKDASRLRVELVDALPAKAGEVDFDALLDAVSARR